MRITNEDKVYFPERRLTKGDLVRYYLDVANHALPHLRRRLFHMVRYPNGVEGEFFHQKRVPAKHPPYVDECFVQFPSGHSTVFAVLDNKSALEWVANLGCIELHTWHSRVPEIEQPDYLLIDLDPSADGQWPYVRQIAGRRSRSHGRARAGELSQDLRCDWDAHHGSDQVRARVP